MFSRMAAIGSGFECVFILFKRNTTNIKEALNLTKSFLRLDARWNRLLKGYVQLAWRSIVGCGVCNMQIVGSRTEIKVTWK